MENRPSFYRDEALRGEIRRVARETFGDRETISDGQVVSFFGLESGIGALTEEESLDIRLFAEYAGVRIVNAALRVPGAGVRTKRGAMRELSGKGVDDHCEAFGFLPTHDLGHAIVQAATSPDRSPVPGFLRVTPTESYERPEVIREEIAALMWGAFR